jgi:alpha-glucosidase
MEENIQDPELLANRLLEEEEEFHHLNNPAEAIKPIIKKYLGNSITLITLPRLLSLL